MLYFICGFLTEKKDWLKLERCCYNSRCSKSKLMGLDCHGKMWHVVTPVGAYAMLQSSVFDPFHTASYSFQFFIRPSKLQALNSIRKNFTWSALNIPRLPKYFFCKICSSSKMSFSLSPSQFVKSYKTVCPNQLRTIAKYMSRCNDTKLKIGFTKHHK